MFEEPPVPVTDDLADVLAPLHDALRPGGRVVARPGRVSGDWERGFATVDIEWTAADHERTLAALADRCARYDDGSTVCATGGCLVLRAPPDASRRTEDLAAAGWLSPIAARTLAHALALGRNVLFAGPLLPCTAIASAMLAERKRPAVVGARGVPVARGWLRIESAAQSEELGADGVDATSLALPAAIDLMSSRGGIMARVAASRIDRALIRFERAGERSGPSGPLQVLAAIDLLVLVDGPPEPRVREFAEIILHDDGYRPVTLFATGHPPVPTALVPVSPPSFLADLERIGASALADDLRHAAASPPGIVREPRPAARPPVAEIVEMPMPVRAPAPARAPEPDLSLDDAPPPGWELDQLGDDAIAEEVAAISDPDAAVMAATYGLGPPPPPDGVRGPGPYDGPFADALARARVREAELRAELDGEAETQPRDDRETD